MADTAVITRLRSELATRFPGVRATGNTGVCRRVAGSKTWSQHSWGNAVDIYPRGSAEGDRVYQWLLSNKTRLSLSTICWKSFGGCDAEDHQDHIHVDGAPKKSGTPPCASIQDRAADVLGPQSAIPGFAILDKPIDSIANAISSPVDALKVLFIPETWARVLWFVSGTALIAGSVVIFTKELTGKNLLDALPAGRATNLAKGLMK